MHFDLPMQQETSPEAVASLLNLSPSIQNHQVNTETRVSATPWSQFNWKLGTPFGPQYFEVLVNEIGGGAESSNDNLDSCRAEMAVEMQGDESIRTDTAHLFDTVLGALELLDSTDYKSLLLDVPNMTEANMMQFWNLYFEKFHKVIDMSLFGRCLLNYSFSP